MFNKEEIEKVLKFMICFMIICNILIIIGFMKTGKLMILFNGFLDATSMITVKKNIWFFLQYKYFLLCKSACYICCS